MTRGEGGSAAYLDDVPNDELPDLNLLGNASRSDDAESLLAFDSVLEATELLFFGPVIEGSDENDDDDGYKDGNAFNPAVVLLFDIAD